MIHTDIYYYDEELEEDNLSYRSIEKIKKKNKNSFSLTKTRKPENKRKIRDYEEYDAVY